MTERRADANEPVTNEELEMIVKELRLTGTTREH